MKLPGFFTLKLTTAVAALFFSSLGYSQSEPNTNAASPQVQIRIVSKDAFCSRLQQTFVQFASTSGYNKLQTRLIAATGSDLMLKEFQNGRATDYMDVSTLAQMAKQPNLSPKDTYLQIPAFIGRAMGLSQNVLLALTPGELRFIPYAPKNSDMVVIAQNAAALTEGRTKKIVEIARANHVRVSVLWVGQNTKDQSDLQQTRYLGWIVAMTGGFLADLSGDEGGCQSVM